MSKKNLKMWPCPEPEPQSRHHEALSRILFVCVCVCRHGGPDSPVLLNYGAQPKSGPTDAQGLRVEGLGLLVSSRIFAFLTGY